MPSKEQEIAYWFPYWFGRINSLAAARVQKLYPGTFKIQTREHFSLNVWMEPWNKLGIHWSVLDSFKSRSEDLLENMN